MLVDLSASPRERNSRKAGRSLGPLLAMVRRGLTSMVSFSDANTEAPDARLRLCDSNGAIVT